MNSLQQDSLTCMLVLSLLGLGQASKQLSLGKVRMLFWTCCVPWITSKHPCSSDL